MCSWRLNGLKQSPVPLNVCDKDNGYIEADRHTCLQLLQLLLLLLLLHSTCFVMPPGFRL